MFQIFLLAMASNTTIFLLDKYPHMRLLAKRRMEDVTKHVDARDYHEGVGERERISLLGPAPYQCPP